MILNGSLRHNLDLLGHRSDEEIYDAVEVVGLSQMVQNLGGLDGDLPMKVRPLMCYNSQFFSQFGHVIMFPLN